MTVTFDARDVELRVGSGPKQKLVAVRFKEAVDATMEKVKALGSNAFITTFTGEVILDQKEFERLRSKLLGEVGQEVMTQKYKLEDLERAAVATAKALDEACEGLPDYGAATENRPALIWERVPCRDCIDGSACLPGGCGVIGCQRCEKPCPTCGGSCEVLASVTAT